MKEKTINLINMNVLAGQSNKKSRNKTIKKILMIVNSKQLNLFGKDKILRNFQFLIQLI